MKIFKLLPIIAIALLAACRSTVPQSESLLEEHTSSIVESSSSVAVEVDFSKPRFLSPEDSAAIFKDLSKYVFDSIIFDMSENFLDDFRGGCDGTPSLALCDIHYDKQKIHLNILSQNKKYQFNLNIENGIATVKKTFNDYDDEKMRNLCTEHKNDSTKKNVTCNSKSISFSFKDNINGYDLRNLGGEYYEDCVFGLTHVNVNCGIIHNLKINEVEWEEDENP